MSNAKVGDDPASSVNDRAPAATRGDAPTARSNSAVPATAPRPVERGLIAGPKVLTALIVVGALVIFDLATRFLAGVPPAAAPGSGVVPGASATAPSALIVGLTIESPRDGQAVATKDITVIGIAPPGLTITRDVSLGLDQHATADGTGHWAINVGLDQGENKLVFRIGDDRSTEQQIRVIYTPQSP